MRRERDSDGPEGRRYEWRLTTAKGREFTMVIRIKGENATAGDEVSVVEGETNPLLGWYSARYNELVPAPTIRLLLKPRDRIEVTTHVAEVRR